MPSDERVTAALDGARGRESRSFAAPVSSTLEQAKGHPHVGTGARASGRHRARRLCERADRSRALRHGLSGRAATRCDWQRGARAGRSTSSVAASRAATTVSCIEYRPACVAVSQLMRARAKSAGIRRGSAVRAGSTSGRTTPQTHGLRSSATSHSRSGPPVSASSRRRSSSA